MQVEAGETEVDRNYKEFRKVLPDLLRRAPGKYVVMHGGKLVEFFDTFGDAVRHGQGKFGKDKFSVQEITSRSVSLGYHSYALHHIKIEPTGPIIELGISAPASQIPAGGIDPPIQWIRAIVDTGCSHTSIHSTVARRCGLSIVSTGSAQTPGGVVATNIYHGDLVLRPMVGSAPFEWRFHDIGIVEMVNPNPDFEALLGIDIICQGIFVTNGSVKLATFCW